MLLSPAVSLHRGAATRDSNGEKRNRLIKTLDAGGAPYSARRILLAVDVAVDGSPQGGALYKFVLSVGLSESTTVFRFRGRMFDLVFASGQ